MPKDKSDPSNVELVAESLESDDSSIKTTTSSDKAPLRSDKIPALVNSDPSAPKPDTGPFSRGPLKKLKKFTQRFNVYILGFILLLVLIGASVVVFTVVQRNADKATINNGTLSEDALKQLSKADVTVGDPKQVLKVQSSAVFDGQVLVKGNLDVAGTINVGGALSLPGITVSGDSSFESVNVSKALNIGGDATVQGQLAIKKGVAVTGGATFGGPISAPQITTGKLQLLGDLAMTSHLIAGGPTPGRSSGNLGPGGTSSVSGSDTAGTVNFNTGSGPGTGCMVTVNFTSKYANTPRVVITPNNAASATIQYYVTRSTSGFSVCSVGNPASSTGYGYDYFVLG